MRCVARAVLVAVMAVALLAGCGDSGGAGAGTATTAAKAVCTKAAILAQLRAIGAGNAVDSLRCAPGYAFTRVRDGGRGAVVLWRDAAGTWTQDVRDVPGACPAAARSRSLCTPAAPDPALRRCTQAAFLHALRLDIHARGFRIESERCSGDFARTTFRIDSCQPGQAPAGYVCVNTRVAAWRRDATRWKLIAYRPKLACAELQAAAPKYPETLCR
jgi:hypothetical protein